MDTLLRDLRGGVRRLIADPAFTVIAVLCAWSPPVRGAVAAGTRH